MRVIIANATDLERRREVYGRFIRAYGETIEWMYTDDRAIEAFGHYASISPAMARRVRDNFYPKTMLQLDRVMGLAELVQDAIAFKYVAQPLTPAQTAELLQTPRPP